MGPWGISLLGGIKGHLPLEVYKGFGGHIYVMYVLGVTISHQMGMVSVDATEDML